MASRTCTVSFEDASERTRTARGVIVPGGMDEKQSGDCSGYVNSPESLHQANMGCGILR